MGGSACSLRTPLLSSLFYINLALRTDVVSMTSSCETRSEQEWRCREGGGREFSRMGSPSRPTSSTPPRHVSAGGEKERTEQNSQETSRTLSRFLQCEILNQVYLSLGAEGRLLQPQLGVGEDSGVCQRPNVEWGDLGISTATVLLQQTPSVDPGIFSGCAVICDSPSLALPLSRITQLTNAPRAPRCDVLKG